MSFTNASDRGIGVQGFLPGSSSIARADARIETLGISGREPAFADWPFGLVVSGLAASAAIEESFTAEHYEHQARADACRSKWGDERAAVSGSCPRRI